MRTDDGKNIIKLMSSDSKYEFSLRPQRTIILEIESFLWLLGNHDKQANKDIMKKEDMKISFFPSDNHIFVISTLVSYNIDSCMCIEHSLLSKLLLSIVHI